MRLTILYDNTVTREGLTDGWGFSCLIESEKNILFDTGWKGSDLKRNMAELGFKIEDVDVVALSHQHWDHIGGLPCILNDGENLEACIPASFMGHLKEEVGRHCVLHEVAGAEMITESVWTTGELKGEYKGAIMEQSLILKTDRGVVALTGCSHSGVKQILAAASQHGKLYGLIGGLHGFDELPALEGLGLIVPTHCSAHALDIRERYPRVTHEGGVGWSITL
jgi:7,8-dihydropterin-6-yl-methyl-4-(beta-D-ribofuranosyl)aminobenzene 5'-phosphate synthase